MKSLAFRVPSSEGDPLVLASGSQDGTIRLWNIDPLAEKKSDIPLQEAAELSDALLDAFEASLGELGDAEEGGRQISLKRHILTVKAGQTRYAGSFEGCKCAHLRHSIAVPNNSQ